MLDAIGECERLDLMINSGGGSGEAAEKLVEMCRAHCREEFRVIVPNFAKSAATMIALGADVIVMGYPSELGPIDPQYQIAVANIVQWVSGQSFLQAYEAAQQAVQEAIASGVSPVGLSPESEHEHNGASVHRALQARDRVQPGHHQEVPSEVPTPRPPQGTGRDPTLLKHQSARSASPRISSPANARFSHGRLISAEEARDEVGLHIDLLDREDPIWSAYWELYLRAEVYMQSAAMGEARVSKNLLRQDVDAAGLLKPGFKVGRSGSPDQGERARCGVPHERARAAAGAHRFPNQRAKPSPLPRD